MPHEQLRFAFSRANSYNSDMPYDMDGFWDGPENPMCPICLDEAMDDTPSGYHCTYCGFETVWNEDLGTWEEQAPKDRFYERWIRYLQNKPKAQG